MRSFLSYFMVLFDKSEFKPIKYVFDVMLDCVGIFSNQKKNKSPLM